MSRQLSVRKLRRWRLLSDGGNILFDTLLAKLWETPDTFDFLDEVNIERVLNIPSSLKIRGLLHIRRQETRKIQINREKGVTTYNAELDIPEVAIDFEFPVKFLGFSFNVSGKIKIDHVKMYLELSERKDKIMLEFAKTVSMANYCVHYDNRHRHLRRIFRRRISAIMEETDSLVGRTIDFCISKAVNKILATDEAFQ